MEKLLFIAICTLLTVVQISAVKKPLNNFIRHHERLNYDTEDVDRRVRRAIDLSPYANVHIKFKAHNLNFTLHTRRNHHIFAKDFKIVDGFGNRIHYDFSKFIHGDVEGFPRSYVTGKIEKGRFEGSIHLNHDQFHVEPAERYFKDDSTAVHHSVIYSHRDVEHNAKYGKAEVPERPSTLKGSSLYKTMEAEKAKLEEESKEHGKQRYRRGTKNRHKNTCNLKLVGDHLFMKKFVRRETAIDQMVLHYQAVEFIFRNQTFNTTNEYDSTFSPEGIGFRIKEVHIWLEESVPTSLAPKHISIYRLLELFSRMNHSSVCLAYLFTDRSFDDGVMGLAYIAYRYGQPGGICDPYAKYGDTWKTYNTGIVTFQLYNREAPPIVTEITLAHELGHSFGAQHDPETKECTPGPENGGNFIMFDKATPGHLKNNRAFSTCSKAAMIPVINAKGLETTNGCFEKRYWAICGNGAHEEGEICDCGTVSTCVEQCCTPLGSKTGTPCTLQNDAYECSPSRGPCCLNDTCTLAREHLKCFDGTECQESLQCNGLHFTCPERKPKKNNTLCDKDRSVCINGYCQGSLCLKYGYEGCPCKNPEDKCKVCCLIEGDQCVPSHEITGMPNTTMTRGTPCDYYKGYCDALGKCQGIDMDGPLRMLYYTFFTEEGIKIWFARYWYVVLLGAILILCMLTAFVYYCQAFTPTNNPKLNDVRPVKPIRRRRQQAGYQPGRPPMAQTYT